MNPLLSRTGRHLARYLARRRPIDHLSPPTPPDQLLASLRPGDVLLVEGASRFSTAIKYLTQSTWSHAALYVGHEALQAVDAPAGHAFVEADVAEGVRSVGVDEFEGLHTRICRPRNLRDADREQLLRFAIRQLGHQYDMRNIVDLLRYLIPTPPVPARWRRQLLSLGSGDPSQAICSTLIAQAFQSIRYPILPRLTSTDINSNGIAQGDGLIHGLRHYSLFVPRDFDVSPYFDVVKPSLNHGFDYTQIVWDDWLPLPSTER